MKYLPYLAVSCLISLGSCFSATAGPIAASPAANAVTPSLRPYQIEYKILRRGSEYGRGQRSLLQVEDNLWYLETSTDISWFFLSDIRTEKSWFRVFPDHVEPLQYKQIREGTGRDYLSFILFDHRRNKIKEAGDYDKFKAHYKAGLLDGASYQFQMSRDIESGHADIQYPIIIKGENRDYRYRVIGEELLRTPFGQVATVKLERVRTSSTRQTFVWLAKDYAYAIARIWQAKEGEEQADLIMSGFKWLKTKTHPTLKAEIK